MSTRALYSFIDTDNPDGVLVYKHHDGYPAGGLHSILSAIMFAWELPRFEADEFAAAFVAANKSEVVKDIYPELLKALTGSEEDTMLDVTVQVREYSLRHGCGGGVRLLPHGNGITWVDVAPLDIAYVYQIERKLRGIGRKAVPELYVTISRPTLDDERENFIGLDKPVWEGFITEFIGKSFKQLNELKQLNAMFE